MPAGSRLKIGIDCSEMEGKPTGVGRYLLNLLRYWREFAPEHEYLCYFMGEIPSADFLYRSPFSLKLLYPVPVKSRLLWEQWQLLQESRRDRVDLFFSPGYSVPLRLSCPGAMTIHDISFEAHPEWFPLADGIKRRYICRQAVMRADTVFTDSRFSCGEIITHYQVPPSKIKVIPIGVEKKYFQRQPSPVSEALKERLAIKGRIILHVGTILNRRAIPDLLRGFSHIARRFPDVTLVIVGENRTYPRIDLAGLLQALQVTASVILLDFIPEKQLLALYSLADLFIYLSHYEGFGLPPLEAMCFGLPVVISGTGALREIYGDAAFVVEQITPDAIASALECLLEDRGAREALSTRGTALTERYPWKKTADQTLRHLLDLVKS